MLISPATQGTDQQLLEMLTDPHADLVSIAAVNGLTLLEFLEWANEPRIKEALKGLRRLHRTRADLLAQEAAASAIKTLKGIVDHHDHETRNTLPPADTRSRAAVARQSETARRACGQLLRAAGSDRSRVPPRTATRSKSAPGGMADTEVIYPQCPPHFAGQFSAPALASPATLETAPMPSTNPQPSVQPPVPDCVRNATERVPSLINAGTPPPEILSQLVAAGERIAGDGCVCSILVLDQDGLLRNGASPNLPADYLDAIDRLKPDPGVGTCAAAAATGCVTLTPDFMADDKWAELRHLPMSIGFKSAWSMPIKSRQGSILGTFGTYFPDCRKPSQGEIAAVEKLAAAASLVLDHR
jgi:hypothetical protein